MGEGGTDGLDGAIVIGAVGAGFAVERAGPVSPMSETAIGATLDVVPLECPGSDLPALASSVSAFVRAGLGSEKGETSPTLIALLDCAI